VAATATADDRGDLKSTAYEFFVLRRCWALRDVLGLPATTFLSLTRRTPPEVPPDLVELPALLGQQEETTARRRAKLEELERSA
jgi:hypothetical protein